MKQNIYQGEWAGCSDFKERREQLSKAHQEFQNSELKKMLDNGFRLKEVRHKRPRIKKTAEPEFKIVMVFGRPVKLTIQEYKDHWTFDIQK